MVVAAVDGVEQARRTLRAALPRSQSEGAELLAARLRPLRQPSGGVQGAGECGECGECGGGVLVPTSKGAERSPQHLPVCGMTGQQHCDG